MVGNGSNSQNAPPPNVTFSEQQFETALDRILDRILARGAPPQPALNVHQAEHLPEERFRPQDLGFFDPLPQDAAKPSSSTDGKTTYHNVFSFTARVRVKSQGVTSGPWESRNLATKLDQCLKGKAELWYTNEISVATRAGLKTGIDIWCSELEAR